MRIDKSIKTMPWPEAYHGGQQHFAVTLSWPTVGHERLLVATFVRNRDKQTYRPGPDFRLVCSKKDNTAAIIFQGEQAGKRWSLDKALRTWGTSVTYCYPEISEQDEIALAKWLRRRGTDNHLLPELDYWVERAQEAETLAERDARGELRDEDVDLCPEELPAGLVEYIRREVLPTDNVLIYKKGNVRGTCYCCGRKVKARHPQRFRQNKTAQCPECGATVRCFLEGGASYKADYVDDIATIQRGTDGATLFVRQWHLCRGPEAAWENIPAQLEEVARYAVRGNRAAKWQHEAKESWYMNAYRYRLDRWNRVGKVSYIYDGQYFFYLPEDWKEQLQGTSLRYCDLGGYIKDTKDARRNRNPIRFLLDWGRYPAVEKLWKAGYTNIVHRKVMGGLTKEDRNAILWSKGRIQEAVRFPFRLLKGAAPAEWTIARMQKTTTAWEMCRAGRIREAEIAELVAMPCSVDEVQLALGHASVHKIAAYVEKITAKERHEREQEKAKALAAGERWWDGGFSFRAPQTYRDYLRECEQLALDLDDRAVLFPANLHEAHARTITQMKYKADPELQSKFAKQVRRLEKMAWEFGGLLIRPAKTDEELIYEGAYLTHCVGGYATDMANGETAIFFVRQKEKPDVPFYTLELRGNTVIQCRTTHNKTYTQDERVAAFVAAWVKHIKKKSKKKTKATVAA